MKGKYPQTLPSASYRVSTKLTAPGPTTLTQNGQRFRKES